MAGALLLTHAPMWSAGKEKNAIMEFVSLYAIAMLDTIVTTINVSPITQPTHVRLLPVLKDTTAKTVNA